MSEPAKANSEKADFFQGTPVEATANRRVDRVCVIRWSRESGLPPHGLEIGEADRDAARFALQPLASDAERIRYRIMWPT